MPFHHFSITIVFNCCDGYLPAGTITSGLSRFSGWKTPLLKKKITNLQNQVPTYNLHFSIRAKPFRNDIMFQGMLDKKVLIDLIRYFIVFEKTKEKHRKKLQHIISIML
jgi:type I restriction enzyme R subunit